MATPVSATLRPYSGSDPDKYRASIDTTITAHGPGLIDLTAAERQQVLDAVVAAVRAALPAYSVEATITSEDVTTV